MKKIAMLNIIYLLFLFHCNQVDRPFDITPLALLHVTIVDVEKGTLIQDQSILIYNNKINSIGKTGSVKVPSGSKIINASGKFIIPGLWDAHVHLSSIGSDENQTDPEKNATQATLSFSLKLFDTNGDLKRSATSKNGKVMMNIKDVEDGLYYLHVMTDKETVSSDTFGF